MYEWVCDCKGFQVRKTCKHCPEAEKRYCGWNQYHDGGEPKDGQCPRCGGDVIVIQVGV